MPVIRIATRKSPLALWQAEHVQRELEKTHPDLQVELVPMSTQGDRFLSAPLSQIGGKGLFMKELEQAILQDQADIAVHSMKDVTADFPPGLQLSVIMQREDPRDAFISNKYSSIAELPGNAVVGTSSVRRQCQLRKLRSDLELKDLRGNVGTRLGKLDDGQYDAIILATAGVKRLGLAERIREYIATDILLPAVGQAAIGIETREDDSQTIQLISCLEHSATASRINAERAVSKKLYGGCQLPIAAYAELNDDVINMRGLVGRIDGSEIITADIKGHANNAESLGEQVAEQLLSKGADKILESMVNRD